MSKPRPLFDAPRPYFGCPPDAWAIARESIPSDRPGGWDIACAVADLRWFADEVKMGRRKSIPGAETLAAVWGWSEWKARRLMVSPWQDPAQIALRLRSGESQGATRDNVNNHDSSAGKSRGALRSRSTRARARAIRSQRINSQTHLLGVNRSLRSGRMRFGSMAPGGRTTPTPRPRPPETRPPCSSGGWRTTP